MRSWYLITPLKSVNWCPVDIMPHGHRSRVLKTAYTLDGQCHVGPADGACLTIALSYPGLREHITRRNWSRSERELRKTQERSVVPRFAILFSSAGTPQIVGLGVWKPGCARARLHFSGETTVGSAHAVHLIPQARLKLHARRTEPRDVKLQG